MNRLITVIVLLINTTLCSWGQIAEDGHYFQVPELKNLQGTWIGTTNGKDKIVVELKSVKNSFDKYFIDSVKGRYTYSLDNKIKDSEGLLTGILYGESPPIQLKLQFLDSLKNKTGDLFIEMTSSLSKEAKWKLKNKEVLLIEGRLINGEEWDPTFSVPTEITLKKIN